jgi:hypothetical protein
MQIARCSCQILMKLDFSRQIFVKYPNSPRVCSMSTDGETVGQADVTKLVVDFRNFANAHETVNVTRMKCACASRPTIL